MEQFQLQCPTHKLSLAAVLFQSESYQQISKDSVLKCVDCIIEQQINGKDLISFSELKNPANPSINVFNSLPLNPTQATKIKFLQDKYSSTDFTKTRQQINNFFQRFLKEVSEKIHFLEKEALMKLDQIEQGLGQVFNQESFKTFKQNLYSTILAGQGDSAKLNREVVALIQAYKQTSSVERFKRIEQDLDILQQKLFLFSEQKANAEKDKVLQQFQIENFFEFEKIPCSLKQFELIKSQIRNSEQAMISRNENGGVIIKNPKEGRILAYSNLIIDPQLKYLITIEIHNQTLSGYQLVGLTDDGIKEKQLLYEQNLTFCNYTSIYGLTKKIKGECFSQSLRKVQDFELQIQMCLQDKLFIVSDFPEKNNIFALQEAAIQDKQYRLGVELNFAEDSINIKKIEIVQSFPSLL